MAVIMRRQGFSQGFFISKQHTATNRHAYLIMAHNNPDQLGLLLRLLDHERNDIFLHVDKKSRSLAGFNAQVYVTKSCLYSVQSMNTNWGSASLVLCELGLLKAATEIGYAYYHLISGADLPLKPQNAIHQFFDQHMGLEFIHFDTSGGDLPSRDRVAFYHIFQEWIGRFNKKGNFRKVLFLADKCLVFLQRLFGVDRVGVQTIYKGCNWFSITHSLATYVVGLESWIREFIKFSLMPDELFLQTLVMQSPYKNSLFCNSFDDNYWACLRYIDWTRGTPYVFRQADFDTLIESNFLFARKFDMTVDATVIQNIVARLN